MKKQPLSESEGYEVPQPEYGPAYQPQPTLPDPSLYYAGQGQVGPTQMPMRDSSLIKWQQDTLEVVEELTLKLRGYSYSIVIDKESGEIRKSWKKERNPLISAEGEQRLLFRLNSLVNKLSIMSNFTFKEINERCFDFEIGLCKWLFVNYGLYSVSKSDRDILIDSMIDATFTILKRAESAGDREYSSGIAREGWMGRNILQPGQPQGQQGVNFSL